MTLADRMRATPTLADIDLAPDWTAEQMAERYLALLQIVEESADQPGLMAAERAAVAKFLAKGCCPQFVGGSA